MIAEKCPTQDQLRACASGNLNSDQAHLVLQHAESCVACRTRIDQVSRDEDTLIAGLRNPDQTNDFDDETPLHEAMQAAAAMSASTDTVSGHEEATMDMDLSRRANPVMQLRDYQLMEKLGEGGMGAVYKAIHTKLDKTVAVKVLRVEAMQDESRVARFQREMKAVGALDHPNIVGATDAGEVEGVHFLAMEYVDGSNLDDVVRHSGPLPIADVCEVIRQAAFGLANAHEHGLIHRDIKPSNVMLTTKGEVKLLDLGLARLQGSGDGLTADSQVVGTVDYMAPEQAAPGSKLDRRTDIYALGCTLYKLLVGKTPFNDETHDSVVKKLMAHASEAIPNVTQLRQDVPRDLVPVIERMLAKNPDERFDTAADVVDALAPFAEASDLARLSSGGGTAAWQGDLTKPSVQPAGGVGTTHRESRRRASGWLWWSVPTLLVAAAAAVVVLQFKSGDGTLVIEITDPAVEAKFSASGLTIQDTHNNKSYTLKVKTKDLPSGDYRILVADDGGLEVDTREFKLTRKRETRVRVTLKRSDAEPSQAKQPSARPPIASAPFFANNANKHQESWADFLGVPARKTNSLGMKFSLIPPGEFDMGSSPEAIEHWLKATGGNKPLQTRIRIEGPSRRVSITKPLYFGIFEVTQSEFQQVTGTNPSEFAATGANRGKVEAQDTSSFPVDNVSWLDAIRFCNQLSEAEGLTPCYQFNGNEVDLVGQSGYRLPTEAEWEFACRAGSTHDFSFGDSRQYPWRELDAHGWHGSGSFANSSNMTHPVGNKRANAFGLFDMYGNVAEWCWDRMAAYEGTVDPKGPVSGGSRVLRGGNWYDAPVVARSAMRTAGNPTTRSHLNGFRIVLPVASQQQELASSKPSSNTPDLGADRGEWVDLLALVELERDALQGNWERTDDGLVAEPKGEHARVVVPVSPQGNYQLELDFTTADDDLHLYVNLFRGGRDFSVKLGDPSGIHMIGDYGPYNKNSTTTPMNWNRGQRYSVVMRVETTDGRSRIAVTVDGNPLIVWAGNYRELRLSNSLWRLPNPQLLGLSVGEGRDAVTFHKFRLTMLSRELQLVRPAPEHMKLPEFVEPPKSKR
jgi:serine/threonine protein kinase